jgi:arsenite-transporting ATPase
MQINPEKAREEFRAASQQNGGTGVKDFMDSMGLGVLVEQVHVHIFVRLCFRAVTS